VRRSAAAVALIEAALGCTIVERVGGGTPPFSNVTDKSYNSDKVAFADKPASAAALLVNLLDIYLIYTLNRNNYP
jgi:hypothetical protein